jgi:hypothetical protein
MASSRIVILGAWLGHGFRSGISGIVSTMAALRQPTRLSVPSPPCPISRTLSRFDLQANGSPWAAATSNF